MHVQNVELKRIADKGPEAGRYLFSYRPNVDNLVSSIRKEGLLIPPVLREHDNGEFQIVCGFQRIRALQHIGVRHSDAFVLSGSSRTEDHCLRRSLQENLWHRGFNQVEKALVFTRLHDEFPNRIRSVEDILQGDLKVPVKPSALEPYRFILTLPEPMLRSLARGTISMGQALLLKTFSGRTRPFLVRIMEACNLTLQESRQLAEWFQDRLEQDILGDEKGVDSNMIERLLEEPLSPRKRAENLFALLRKMRYPVLESWKQRFNGAKKELGFTDKDIRVLHDPTFETTEIQVRIRAVSHQDFREKIGLLSQASQEGKVRKLFDTLEPG